MNTTHPLLADWLRVERELGPLEADDRRTLLSLLQIDGLLEGRTEQRGLDSPPRPLAGSSARAPEPARGPGPADVPPPAEAPGPFTVSPPVREERPARLSRTGRAFEMRSRAVKQSAPEPLFDRRTERAILARAGAVDEPLGEIDVERVARALSRLELLRTLPRHPAATDRRGVQVLVDVSPSMIPFAVDCAQLTEALGRVIRVNEALEFAGSPLRGVGRLGETWRPWRPPPKGTVVMTVSDLGTVAPPFEAPSCERSDWLRFAAVARHAQTPVVVMVPQEPKRWPPQLERLIALVPWDRPTTASMVSRALEKAARRSA